MAVHEAPYETLIEPAQLRPHLHDPRWVVIDCRFDLARPQAGREAYRRAHIPGARYAHLDEDLSSPVTPATGRHPLPDARVLAGKLARWGVHENSQVVAYDGDNSAFASRLWWLLRWLGHQRVAVLNGGFKAWLSAGYEQDDTSANGSDLEPLGKTSAQLSGAGVPGTSRGSSEPAGTEPLPPPSRAGIAPWLTTAQVQQRLGKDILLIDARTADRFAGQNEIIDPVAGHIPGAINHPFPTNLDADQRFLPAEQLRANWLKTLGDAPASSAVCMCGSGVTACHNLLALQIAGLAGASLYAGSWSEWIRDPNRPITS